MTDLDTGAERVVDAWKNTGWRRIVKAGGYSFNGLKLAFIGEAAFRQECLLALVFVPLAFFAGESSIEQAVLVGVTLLVLVVELLNSAIEALVDRVGTEYHALSGQAKDIGSAAVFVALMLWAIVWGLLLLD